MRLVRDSEGATARVNAEDAMWTWLGSLAAGASHAEAALALARLLAQENAAERAFVASVGSDGEILAAWGADLDGLPIAAPSRRIDAELLQAALGREAPVYLGDVETSGGRGSRLAVAAQESEGGGRGRALVVLEHRFAPFAFDRVTAALAARWVTLAGIVLRLGERGAPAQAEPLPDEDAAVTSRRASSTAPARSSRPRALEGEREAVARALEASDGNITRAAQALGISRQGLKKRMVRLGMRAPATGSEEGPPERALPLP